MAVRGRVFRSRSRQDSLRDLSFCLFVSGHVEEEITLRLSLVVLCLMGFALTPMPLAVRSFLLSPIAPRPPFTGAPVLPGGTGTTKSSRILTLRVVVGDRYSYKVKF